VYEQIKINVALTVNLLLVTESFDRENAFGILQQQHVHCHPKIHTQNAYHNIPRVKTQKETNLPTIHNAAATYG
jgi:hypothetical protein